MRETRTELGVGESIQIGEHLLTVVEMTAGEVVFRVDEADPHSQFAATAGFGGMAEPPSGLFDFFFFFYFVFYFYDTHYLFLRPPLCCSVCLCLQPDTRFWRSRGKTCPGKCSYSAGSLAGARGDTPRVRW
jgi:hypothetical protein